MNTENYSPILIIAAHPDDEILGAAGTLIKHSRSGSLVYALILSQGVTARTGFKEEERLQLRQQTLNAAKIVGFREVFFADFPDNQFDRVPLLEIVKIIEHYLRQIKPKLIYTHHVGDLNLDHRLAFQAVITACRPCHQDYPAEIRTFETLSSTEWQVESNHKFKPSLYINIESELDDKIKALEAYSFEIRDYPHPRSAEGIQILAQYRGLESGLRKAEAFDIVRRIIK